MMFWAAVCATLTEKPSGPGAPSTQLLPAAVRYDETSKDGNTLRRTVDAAVS